MDLKTQPRLIDRFLVFPTSVIDRRSGRWKNLRDQWEIPTDGRDNLLYQESDTDVGSRLAAYSGGTSRFDPALMHLLVHWYTKPGDLIIDPFAGGPVRGIVATTMNRDYIGIDIDPTQVQRNLASGHRPVWEVGDATTWEPPPADAVITCPPYGDLERYTDDPADLSTMKWAEFQEALNQTITAASAALRDNRYSAWVISDIRNRKTGELRDLPGQIVRAHQAAGLTWIDDLVLVDPIGTNRLRAKRPFIRSRLSLRTHQRVLVFVKDDRHEAAWRIYDELDIPGRDWVRDH